MPKYRINTTTPWGRAGHVVPIVDSALVQHHVERGNLTLVDGDDPLPMPEAAYDPADYSVDEVNEYLDTLEEDSPERDRVLLAEKEGKKRKGVLDRD